RNTGLAAACPTPAVALATIPRVSGHPSLMQLPIIQLLGVSAPLPRPQNGHGGRPLTGCICTKIPFFQRVSPQPETQNANGAVDAERPANKEEAKTRGDEPASGAAD